MEELTSGESRTVLDEALPLSTLTARSAEPSLGAENLVPAQRPIPYVEGPIVLGYN